MKNYMSVCVVDGKDILGFELQARSMKQAKKRSQDMLVLARPKLKSATWMCTSRLKAKGDEYTPVDKSMEDWMVAVDEWVTEKRDLLPVVVPPITEVSGREHLMTTVPPKEVKPQQTTKSWTAGTYALKPALSHPLTEEIIKAARDISHYVYTGSNRKEVFK